MAPSGRSPSMRLTELATPTIGSTIGAYKLLGLLGRGGMGTVFRAEHTMLDREVAIKVIHPEMVVKAGFLERFFNEARAVNKIRHKHIVDIYDIGQTDEGLAYCVMEL